MLITWVSNGIEDNFDLKTIIIIIIVKCSSEFYSGIYNKFLFVCKAMLMLTNNMDR